MKIGLVLLSFGRPLDPSRSPFVSYPDTAPRVPGAGSPTHGHMFADDLRCEIRSCGLMLESPQLSNDQDGSMPPEAETQSEDKGRKGSRGIGPSRQMTPMGPLTPLSQMSPVSPSRARHPTSHEGSWSVRQTCLQGTHPPSGIWSCGPKTPEACTQYCVTMGPV